MGPGHRKDAGDAKARSMTSHHPTNEPAASAQAPGRARRAMADKSPRHATIKKPSKTIKQKRATKKLKLEQATRRDVMRRRPRPVTAWLPLFASGPGGSVGRRGFAARSERIASCGCGGRVLHLG